MQLTRPALRYYGGKFRLAPWIISFFPAHTCYCEPFGGAMSVMLQKAVSELEVYNDQDGEVVNFFRVLRSRQEELLQAIRLTPFSREEYVQAHELVEDELERARRLYIRSWQGIGGPRNRDRTGWRMQKNGHRFKTTIQDWTEIDHLQLVVQRMRSIQIEHDDALKIIWRFDTPGTLFYCDPPYPAETRTQRWREKGYRHEMDNGAHRELAQALHEIQGMAIVSSYPSALYAELYHDWQTVTKRSRINSMHRGAELRTECLWISPRAAATARQKWFTVILED